MTKIILNDMLISEDSVMGLFNFFGKSNSSQPNRVQAQKNRDEMKERLMATLTTNLSAHNFTKMEIKEVFDIIELAEADIQSLKDSLVQIKQTSANPTAAILKIKKEVEFIQQQMAADIKTKIRQIKLRKQQFKKERI